MKVVIERAVLFKALSHVHSLVESRTSLDILANVLIDASGDGINLTTTDMSILIVENVAAEILEKGATTVSARTLHQIVSKLPDGLQIEMREDAGAAGRMELIAGRGRFTLPSLSPENFPVLPSADMAHRFQIEAKELCDMIDQTHFAMSTEETRLYLNGIYVHVVQKEKDHFLTFVATDGHRLARSEISCPDQARDMPGIIMPGKTVKKLQDILKDCEGKVDIALSETKAVFSVERIVLTSKLVDGQFPEYERVIPRKNDKILQTSRNDFYNAVDRVQTISPDKSRAVKIALSDNLLTVSASSPDSGDAVEEVAVDYKSASLSVGFNAQYLKDIVEQIKGETVRFDLADSSDPAVIQDSENHQALYVLMPMRV